VTECATLEDLERYSGSEATVTGAYEQVDVRMRPRGSPVHRGHVGVRLRDGTLVLLGPSWSPAAIRPTHELERFTGRQVTVSGTVHAPCSEPPETSAHIVGPCIDPVREVSLRN
jgi:hypothetical protein